MTARNTESGVMKLVRPHLRDLVGYRGVQPAEKSDSGGAKEAPPARIVKLDGNENPYGSSPKIRGIFDDESLFHLYPDPNHRELRAALADYVGVGAERIVAGAGADELLGLIAQLLLEPGDKVINCPPTFGMYKFIVDVSGAQEINVARTPSYDLDVEAIRDAIDDRTKMVFITSPNNPTGNSVTDAEITQLLETGVAVIVDEAYYEFCGQSAVPLVSRYDNLMVIRTFSKWAGLAGIRIGYGVFSPEVAACLSRIKMPYNLSTMAQRAGIESLNDLDYLLGNVQKIVRERDRMHSLLTQLKLLRPIPSQGNYIMCEVLGMDAEALHQQLKERQIHIRYFDTPLLRNFVRISVGTPEQTDIVMDVLRTIEGESGG